MTVNMLGAWHNRQLIRLIQGRNRIQDMTNSAQPMQQLCSKQRITTGLLHQSTKAETGPSHIHCKTQKLIRTAQICSKESQTTAQITASVLRTSLMKASCQMQTLTPWQSSHTCLPSVETPSRSQWSYTMAPTARSWQHPEQL